VFIIIINNEKQAELDSRSRYWSPNKIGKKRIERRTYNKGKGISKIVKEQ
jgi:hypothetical protein